MSVILVTEVNEARTQIKHVEATGVLVFLFQDSQRLATGVVRFRLGSFKCLQLCTPCSRHDVDIRFMNQLIVRDLQTY